VGILPNLLSLFVNKVECLGRFFSVVFSRFPRGLRFSVSKIQASEAEWSNTFSLFSAVQLTTLASLIWKSNPVPPPVLGLLGKSDGLESVCLAHCFTESNAGAIFQLASFLRHAPLLRVVDEEHFFGQCFLPVLSTLSSCRGLKLLSLCGAHWGDAGVTNFAKLLAESPNLQIVDFDGMHPESAQPLVDLINTI
jgi:hypothetical protein